MADLKQSTAYTREFLMVDSSDHLSPKTGLTVGVWLSKAGAAFTAVSGSVSEISFGWYKVALNATDTNTLGDLAFHCTGTSADLTDFVDQVRANILGDTLPANVTQWVGVAPNALISGTVDANVLLWKGQTVPTPNQTGIPKVDLVAIDGLGTTGTAATLNLKKLNIVNISGQAVIVSSSAGAGMEISTNGSADSALSIVSNGSSGVGVRVSGDTGVEFVANVDSALLLSAPVGGVSIKASQGIIGDITGSITGNLYGDVYGRVGWVTGSVQRVLMPVSATGTVNANVLQWIGVTPNALISGTVDAFTHYTNYPSSTITGSVDANVITWRGSQPNILISGTVDSYAHYVADKTDYALTSAYNAAKTASQAGDAMTLTAGERNSVADALLKRDWTAVTGEASRSVLNALRFIRNKFSTTATPGVVTIYKEDDAAVAYTKSVTTDATADPIVEG